MRTLCLRKMQRLRAPGVAGSNPVGLMFAKMRNSDTVAKKKGSQYIQPYDVHIELFAHPTYIINKLTGIGTFGQYKEETAERIVSSWIWSAYKGSL